MTPGAAFAAAAKHWKRAAGVFCVLSVTFGNQGFRGLIRSYRELSALRKELAHLEEEASRLESRNRLLKTAESTLERLARRELGFIKPGEIEYRFPPPTVSDGSR